MARSTDTETLAFLIASLNRQIEAELSERLRPGGVAVEQYRVLEALSVAEPCSMGEISDRTLIERPTLTKIVDRMVADALVYRAPDPGDRRRVLVLTTPTGKALYKRLAGVSKAVETGLASRLDPSRVEDLRLLLQDLQS